MPTINILVYTDSPEVNDTGSNDKAVTQFKRLINKWEPAFADLNVTVQNRHDPKNPQRLTPDFLKNFNEIWFFGLEQIPSNGKERELDDTERTALNNWMSAGAGQDMVGGGVLIAGDHSQPLLDEKDVNIFTSRGRALGQDVPRAHQLRVWVGPPSNGSEEPENRNNRFSTVRGSGEENDPLPMSLILSTPPHPLFLGRNRIIDVLPDHNHEGKLLIPDVLDNEWPASIDNGSKPGPAFIAGARDDVVGELPVLSAYDGDAAKVGRIVADSSWHHYMNVNLGGLGEAPGDSPLNLIGQFYSNLAVWLAPLRIRQQMAERMFGWVGNHSEVSEEFGNSDSVIGRVALHYLRQMATECEINELLRAAVPTKPALEIPNSRFMLRPSPLSSSPSIETLIGSVASAFQRYARMRKFFPEMSNVSKTSGQLINEGLRAALQQHANRLGELALSAQRTLENLNI